MVWKLLSESKIYIIDHCGLDIWPFAHKDDTSLKMKQTNNPNKYEVWRQMIRNLLGITSCHIIDTCDFDEGHN